MDILFGILVIFGIALVLTLVLGGWLIVTVLRVVTNGVGRLVRGGRAPSPPLLPSVRCGHPRCRAENPGRARFCRRCGRMMHVREPAALRKVAMW